MTRKEFIEAMGRRWPEKKGQEQEYTIFLEDINNITRSVPEPKLLAVYDRIVYGWEKQGRPPAGILWKFSREIHSASGMNRDDSKYGFLCHECNTLLSENTVCPFCRKVTRVTVVVLKPGGRRPVSIREDCGICTKWELTSGRRGPDCDSWGIGLEGKERELCRNCACFQCCTYEKHRRDNPDGFMNAIREKKVKMPWIESRSADVAPVQKLAPALPEALINSFDEE